MNDFENMNMDLPAPPPFPVKVVYKGKHGLPKYETSGASGMDICSDESIVIPAGQTRLVSTGIFVEIPQMLEMQVRPRSGLSLKSKLRVANTPGTIDSCYRGEVKVIMENTGDVEVTIEDGDRIAQLVLVPVMKCKWKEVESVEEFSSTDRGAGGFGSTGK